MSNLFALAGPAGLHSRAVLPTLAIPGAATSPTRLPEAPSSPGRVLGAGKPQYTGVSRSGIRAGRWRAQLCTGGKIVHLGTFLSEKEAARAWDRAAVAERGRHAQTNFDIGDYVDDDRRARRSPSDRSSDQCSADEAMSEGEESGRASAGSLGASGEDDNVGAKRERGSIDFILNGDQCVPSKRPALSWPKGFQYSRPALPAPALETVERALSASSQSSSYSYASTVAATDVTEMTFTKDCVSPARTPRNRPVSVLPPSLHQGVLPYPPELQRLLALCSQLSAQRTVRPVGSTLLNRAYPAW